MPICIKHGEEILEEFKMCESCLIECVERSQRNFGAYPYGNTGPNSGVFNDEEEQDEE